MDINFSSPLAASVYADMLRMPQHTEALSKFIVTRLSTYDHRRWRLDEDGATPTNYHPLEFRICIGVNRRNIEQTDQGLYCKHIEWLIQSRSANPLGYFAGGGDWAKVINGGLYNHGTILEPNWSVHT